MDLLHDVVNCGEPAAAYRAGTLPDESELPWRLRYLTTDGQAHIVDALYLRVREDFTGENGGGRQGTGYPKVTGSAVRLWNRGVAR